MIGSVNPDERAALAEWVNTGHDYERFHPLCFYGPSIGGLGRWAEASEINALGNLSERDFGPEDVAEALRAAVKVAPSLTLVVNLGADYEEESCIATVVVKNGEVTVMPPGQPTVPDVDTASMRARILETMAQARRGQPFDAEVHGTAEARAQGAAKPTE